MTDLNIPALKRKAGCSEGCQLFSEKRWAGGPNELVAMSDREFAEFLREFRRAYE